MVLLIVINTYLQSDQYNQREVLNMPLFGLCCVLGEKYRKQG